MIVIHQVNCFGVMGTGFAKYVKERQPGCYSDYKEKCTRFALKHRLRDLLGTIQVYEDCEINLTIVNMFSQFRYGRDQQYTDYDAMRSCLEKVRRRFPEDRIVAPYMIGCGAAGGDWDVVSSMLKEFRIDTSTEIVLPNSLGRYNYCKR